MEVSRPDAREAAARRRRRSRSSSTASRRPPGSTTSARADELVFNRSLAREGKLGFWRWLSIFLGIAGTYRQNDLVDVVYERDGRRIVESGLPLVPDTQ